MVFGGIAGINWFNPKDIEVNPYKAKPAIAAVFINDTLFAGDSAVFIRALSLPHNRNTISFSLRALEFTTTGQNQFAYKLEGLDKEWVYTYGDKVRYSNLSSGVYKFVLKVSNNEGIWNNDPLEIQIVIHPPYWQTWWFRVLAVIVFIVLVYMGTIYYIRQKIRAKTKELERQQALNMERLRISKDVHDDLGSGLSKISLMADIAQKRAGGNSLLSNDISHISTVSRELVENMRDLIWVLNPENTTLDQLVARLREYCSDYLDNIPVGLKLDFPDEVPAMRISKEAQRNIFLTVKEAINNSIKHADATEIEVGIKFDKEDMMVVVSDNGKGFEPAYLKRSGHGLRNMNHRIESIGGAFKIESLRGKGTSITITIQFTQLFPDKLPL